MTSSTTRLYDLPLLSAKTALFIAVFTLSNVLFPQLAHLIPGGGFVLLPIYFFTIVAAYKYGWTVGILTALLSPAVNHLLFGMPSAEMLSVIMIKGTLAATAAAYMARKTRTVSIAALVTVVAFYQLTGSAVEWCITGSLVSALQDVRMGIPGMALQVLGGYAVLRIMTRR